MEVIQENPKNFLPDINSSDSAVWNMSASKEYFSQICLAGPKSSKSPSFPRHRVIWFKHHIPSWAFRVYSVATKDKLASWGMQVDTQCVLCTRDNESLPHLFFSCSYAQQVWSSILMSNGLSSDPMDLVGVLSWTRQHRGDGSMALIVYKLSLPLWRERNMRVFKNRCGDCSSLQSLIIEDISACLSSWRGVRASLQNLATAASWRIHRKVFSPEWLGIVVGWLVCFLSAVVFGL